MSLPDPKIAFENGQPVLVAQPEYPGVDPEREDDEKRIRLETINRLISFLGDNAAHPEVISRRVAMIRFLLHKQPRRQCDLARFLRITPAAVSMALKKIADDLRACIGDSE